VDRTRGGGGDRRASERRGKPTTSSPRASSIDSRSLAAGDLFIALHGPNFDGNQFVDAALAAGAVGAVVDQGPAAPRRIVVADTQAALTALGRAARARSRAKVIAVTGSVGKTGTKEALRLALAGQGTTHASAGSLNNHWGVAAVAGADAARRRLRRLRAGHEPFPASWRR